MKTKKILYVFVLAVMAAFVGYSCDSNEITSSEEDVVVVSQFRSVNVCDIEPCGEIKTVNLIAGQNIVAGSIMYANDADYVYVHYATTGDWKLKALHLYVGDCTLIPANKAGNPTIGKFPYKTSFTEYQTVYTFAIPIDQLPDCMCIAAHAELVRVVDGNVVQSETGWGEGTRLVDKGNWAMKFEYCKQLCEPEADKCYQEETAWATGTRFVEKGNWATYTTYVPNETINIYAGQTILVGTITFSEVVEGNVTATINLSDGWVLQNVFESVKVQGYDTTPPDKNPAPGQFTTYKGNELSGTIPAFTYYGIHLDVMKEIPCP